MSTNTTPDKLKRIIEGAMLAAGKPLSIDQILALFMDEDQPSRDEIRAAIAELQADCETRGIELAEVASGFRFQVKSDLAQWVSRLWDEKPAKYSRAVLETLALIAYRQPITRSEIEDVRGVSVSSHIVKSLLEREWIRVIGHRDVPGKPALYGTTKMFLDYFGLKSLSDLPPLAELRNIESIERELDFGGEAKLQEEGESESESVEIATEALPVADAEPDDAADAEHVEESDVVDSESDEDDAELVEAAIEDDDQEVTEEATS
jgi:segregation and condensation protein B